MDRAFEVQHAVGEVTPEHCGFATVAEYAASRKISTKVIYNLAEDPESGFPHLRYGRRIVIPVADADLWARGKQNQDHVT